MLNASVFRPFWRSFALAVLTAFAFALPARATAVDDGFNPNVNGPVFATVTQPDGQILIAGAFTTITPPGSTAPITRNNIARLKADGTVDMTFDPNVNFQVSTMVLQPNGQILIGGKFTVIQPNGGAAGYLRNRIARLNADGTLDLSFDPNCGDPSTGGSLTPQVNTIVLQPEGRILIGGGFTSLQPNGAATPTSVNRLARLNVDGTIDTRFNPNVTINNMVWALALQTDGKILVGGGFTDLKLDSEQTPPHRDRLTRLNRDGTLDLSFFHSNPDNLVTAIGLQRDGRIVIGGDFAKLIPDPAGDSIARNHIAGLSANGVIDTSFVPDANGKITSLVVQPDGKLLAAGYFTVLRSNDFSTVPLRNYIGRYNTDGTLDTDFAPSANYAILSVSLQADGRIIVGGNFSTIQSASTSYAVTRNRLARLNANGNLDKTFEPDSSGRPGIAAVQNGKLIVAGNFSSIGGVTRQGLARINTDTDNTVDASFTPIVNAPIRALLVQPDGKIVIAGAFTTVTPSGSFIPVVRNYLARLNSDGTLDTAFDPAPNGQIYALALQSDNQILLGGSFGQISRHNNVDPNTTDNDNDFRYRTNIARIKSDGTLDDNFDPNANGAVSVIKVQPDGKILLGGAFLTLSPNGSTIAATSVHTARLNADGTLATHFDPAPDGNVTSIVLQSDGKIILAGNFLTISKHNNIDPSNKDNDNDRVTRNRIARLNADGTLDTAYDPNLNNIVSSATLQADGKLLIGGVFTTIQPNGAATATTLQYLGRLNVDGTLDPSFDAGLNQSTDNQVSAIIPTNGDSLITILGGFTSVHGKPRIHLARLTSAGGLDDSFNLAVSGNTDVKFNAIAVQADGKVVAGGKFNSYGGSTSRNLARFLADSSPDILFSADVNDEVNAVLVPPLGAALSTQSNGLASLTSSGHLNTSYPSTQAPDPTYNFSALLASRISGQVKAILVQTTSSGEKKILVAGAFTTNISAVGGNLVRFNQDGTLDTAFNPAPDAVVQAITLDASGRILVGGNFTNITGVSHPYFARLSADGALDTGFTYTTDAQVNAIIVQPDNKILISGAFQYLTLTSGGAVTSRAYAARLNTDGTIDSFDPKANGQIVAMVLQPDNKVVLGGFFTTMQSNGASSTVTRNSISRANADGTLDTTFDPNLDNSVTALALQIDPATGKPNGQILVGGVFTTVKPNGATTTTARTGILRLNSNGGLDPDFHPNANGAVYAIKVQPDGNIIIGGAFTSLRPNDSLRSVTRNYLARLFYTDGTVDPSFDPNANAIVSTVTLADNGTVLVGGALTTLQPSGAILIGGKFTSVNNIGSKYLALINSDGTTNSNFAANPDGPVFALMLEPDGHMIAGGSFSSVGTATSHFGLVRITSDNKVDDTYAPQVINGAPTTAGTVMALAQQADGRLLIGGDFTGVNSTVQARLARLNTDGSVDATFAPVVPGPVSAILVQTDGGILVTYNSATTGRVMRIKADGTLDSSFALDSNVTGSIQAMALRTDGLIYVGGNQAGAGFLRRLNSTGTLDGAFTVPSFDKALGALTLQSDGKLFVGGAFTTVDTVPRIGLARLATDASVFDSITVSSDRTTVTFNHGGSGPQLIGASIDYSVDNRVWTPLGPVTRVGTTGSWQVTGLSPLPLQTYYYIRVRGIIPGTQYSSSSLYETEREFFTYVAPQLTSPTAVNAVAGANFLYATATSGTPTAYAASGLPAGLTIDPDTGLITGTPAAIGTYNVTITAYNLAGSSTMTLVIVVTPAIATPTDARLINVSSNIAASNAHPIISGFVISGNEPRSVLLRAMGPSMASLVSSPVLSMPRLDVYSGGNRIYSNIGWGGSQVISTVSNRLGASPPLTTLNPGDSAAVLTLAPGPYTMVISDASGTVQTGTVLAEVYDASTPSAQGISRVVNLSSRAYLSATNNVLIGGFVLQATTTLPAGPAGTTVYRRVLLRGVGPQLAGYGVGDAIADPQLSVYDSANTLLVQNNDWETPVTNAAYPPANASQLSAAASTLGAFALSAGGKDAALLLSLPIFIAPGAMSGTAVYTAQVSNVTGADGTAMVEIYELPSN